MPIPTDTRLEDVGLLGKDVDIIAHDIYDVIDALANDWKEPKYIPGALVPVILDAIDRAMIQKLLFLKEEISNHPDEYDQYIDDHINKINNRVAMRASKQSEEVV